MKVTEVRTARSCASWLSHYRSRAKPGPILSSSSFFSFQWRVAAKFPHPAVSSEIICEYEAVAEH
jgi:hypothetical protein